MSGNGIGNGGAKALSEVLKVNTTLSILGLSGKKERKKKGK